MSVNATVQRIVDDLFADRLIKGLEATEKIEWVIRDHEGYNPLTGEVTQNESRQSLPAITTDISNTEGKSLQMGDELVIQMQPLDGRTSKQALADSFVHAGQEYSVKGIDVVRLGSKPMLWKVRGT
jgi:hypothetical protein